jgi:nicotinate-nucleotide adenylyltransferase
MDVALLGGSFNPPHFGHLMAAAYVRTVVGVDEVWLVPCFQHPFGKDLVSFEHRVAMCEILGADFGEWLKVCRAEALVGGEGRTIELVEFLVPRFPSHQFRWVIGSDILGDLPKWKSWERIKEAVQITVLHRSGYPSSEAVGPAMPEVSSSEIRRALLAGENPMELLPKSVLKYVRRNLLYSGRRVD